MDDKYNKMSRASLIVYDEKILNNLIENALKNKGRFNYLVSILHDKDLNEEGDDLKPHYHLFASFRNAPITENTAIELFNLPEEQKHLLKKMSGGVTANLCYLIHQGYPDKVLYSKEDLSVHIGSRERVLEIITKGSNRVNLKSLEKVLKSAIANREIRNAREAEEFIISKTNSSKEYLSLYSKIRQWLDAINESNIASCPIKQLNHTVYISGASGSGKSSLARLLCNKNGFDYYETSLGSDLLGNYRNQQAIIIDDVREDTIRNYGFNSFLNLLDPFYSSTQKSRYRDKRIDNVQLIVLTSVIPLEQLFSSFSKKEEIHQVYRRVNEQVLIEEGIATAFIYNEETRQYEEQNGNVVLSEIFDFTETANRKSCLLSLVQ